MASLVDSLVWTDDEIKLLLRVTLDYKSAKYKESCHRKCAVITLAIRKPYPSGDMAVEKDFPHDPNKLGGSTGVAWGDKCHPKSNSCHPCCHLSWRQ